MAQKPTNEDLLAKIEELQAKQEASEKRERLLNTNEARLGGYVSELEALPQSQKKDKDGSLSFDDKGQPQFFDAMYKCQIAGMGLDESAYFGVELANEIVVGAAYLFEGVIKDRKFKVKKVIKI